MRITLPVAWWNFCAYAEEIGPSAASITPVFRPRNTSAQATRDGLVPKVLQRVEIGLDLRDAHLDVLEVVGRVDRPSWRRAPAVGSAPRRGCAGPASCAIPRPSPRTGSESRNLWNVVVVAESETPREHREVLDPVGVPVQHVAVDVDRSVHHLLDHLHVVAELLALDEVDLHLAGRAFVHQLREHRVAAVDDRADRIRAAEGQRRLRERRERTSGAWPRPPPSTGLCTVVHRVSSLLGG